MGNGTTQDPEVVSLPQKIFSSVTESLAMKMSEAKAKGVEFAEEPPEPIICEFCGAMVESTGLVVNGRVILWSSLDCKCAEAVERQARLEREAAEEKRAARMRAYSARLLGDSGIKPRFRDRTFDKFKQDTDGRRRSYEVAKTYADRFKELSEKGWGLYLEGGNGTGKTHLAVAIGLQLISAGVPVICKTSGDLLLDIRNTFDGGDATEAEILDVYKKIDLLIIDDLGKEQVSEWSMSVLFSILNDRYENLKPTVITTNYGSAELIKRLTPKGGDSGNATAIVSRLKESSKIVVMAWKDARGEM